MRLVIVLLLLGCGLGLAAQTQGEMTQEAYEEYRSVDEELNKVYQQVLKLYAKNPEFLASLKKAQRLWVQLRDAQEELVYPERPMGYYGSVMPMCRGYYLAKLTKARVEELKELYASVEGDVCGGVIGDYDAPPKAGAELGGP